MGGISFLFQQFADLLAPVVTFLIWAFPIKIYKIHDGEMGVILSFGKVRRKNAERTPGLTFCFCFEELDRIQAKGGYFDLTDQTVKTRDGKMINIEGSIIYEIVSPSKAILEVEDIENVIAGITKNELREYAKDVNMEDIGKSDSLTQKLGTKVNRKIRKYGARVTELLICDLAPHEMNLLCDTLKDGISIKGLV